MYCVLQICHCIPRDASIDLNVSCGIILFPSRDMLQIMVPNVDLSSIALYFAFHRLLHHILHRGLDTLGHELLDTF